MFSIMGLTGEELTIRVTVKFFASYRESKIYCGTSVCFTAK